LENVAKPRRKTVIFSAFHKLLYAREKFIVKKMFQKELCEQYVDFLGLKAHKRREGLIEDDLFKQPLSYESKRAKTVK